MMNTYVCSATPVNTNEVYWFDFRCHESVVSVIEPVQRAPLFLPAMQHYYNWLFVEKTVYRWVFPIQFNTFCNGCQYIIG